MRHSKPPAKLAMVVVMPLLLLCYGVCNVHCSTVHENSEDFQSLLEFKKGILDHNGALNNWNPNTHFCRWYGVKCTSTRRPLRVKQLNLSGKNLAGNIFSSLGNLAFLEKLDLSNNSFYGPIPDALTNCSYLAYLLLSGNHLTGVIPPTIGFLTSLKGVILDSNYLTGLIPATLINITNLQILSFTQNQLTGSIPHAVMQMPNILELYLNQNWLLGGIPEVWHMPNIELLDLSQNYLSGTIPPSIGCLTRLTKFFLAENRFTGSVPPNLGNLTSLLELDLSDNYFHGGIPETLGKFEHIQTIQLDQNILTGNIPSSFSNLYTLSMLNISHNNLSGPLPAFLNDLKTITKLDISYNNFQGEVPTNGVFANATIISLDDNPGLCGGATDLHLRSCHVMNKKGRAVNYLIKILIPIFGFMSLVLLVYFVLLERKRSRAYISSEQSFVEHFEHFGELMPNGSLDTWLHHKGDEEAPKRLSLTQRISIAVDIADALDYLHHDCGCPTVHCDLKPSNILLDDDNALPGDFGIALFFADPQSTWAGSISSIGMKGTIGYIPPEYGSGGHVSTSGDVYSFGIVLLEILIGKRPTDAMFMDGLDIISFVENSFQSQIFDVMDVHLVEECKNLTQDKNVPEKEINKCLLDLVQVALSCTRSLPSERSNMKQIASEMHAIKVSQLGWIRGGSKGGAPAPLQLVHHWKYGEGEGEEEVVERGKMEREEEEKTSPPFNPVLHPLLG